MMMMMMMIITASSMIPRVPTVTTILRFCAPCATPKWRRHTNVVRPTKFSQNLRVCQTLVVPHSVVMEHCPHTLVERTVKFLVFDMCVSSLLFSVITFVCSLSHMHCISCSELYWLSWHWHVMFWILKLCSFYASMEILSTLHKFIPRLFPFARKSGQILPSWLLYGKCMQVAAVWQQWSVSWDLELPGIIWVMASPDSQLWLHSGASPIFNLEYI